MRLGIGAVLFFLFSSLKTIVAFLNPGVEIGALNAGFAVFLFGLGLLCCAFIARGDK